MTVDRAERPIAGKPPLPPTVRRIFFGFAFSALGSGLTMPFLYVYLAEVRGIATATVGLIFAWMGLVGLAASPLSGTLIDRVGPRRVMLIGLVVEAGAVALLGKIETVPQAVLLSAVMVVGTVGLWPATSAMLTRLVAEKDRERVYGVQFLLLNAGLGVGGLISAAVIQIDSVASFQRLYLLDAASYLVYIAVVLSLPPGTGRTPVGEAPAAVADAAEPLAGLEVTMAEVAAPAAASVATATAPGPAQPGWGAVLADRTFLRVLGLATVAITFGYAQFEAGFAAYAVDVAELPARSLGLAYAANTGAIVLGQLLALRLIGGRRRSLMLALAATVWSASWVVIALSDAFTGTMAVAMAVLGLGLFGVGETIWAPVAPAVVNALAVEELRGRYNAAFGMVWTVAQILGPAMAGLMIGSGIAHLWVAILVAGMATAAVLFGRLRRHLTDLQDGVTD